MVAIDQTHEPGSTTVRRQEVDAPSRVQVFSRNSSGRWGNTFEFEETLGKLNNQADTVFGGVEAAADVEPSGNQNAIQDILYGIENLRKRPGAEE